MNSLQELVVEYHAVAGIKNNLPTIHKHISERQSRQIIHQVAIGELKKAMDAHNGHEIARNLAVCIYRLLSTATSYGVDIEPAFAKVHKQLMDEQVPWEEPF